MAKRKISFSREEVATDVKFYHLRIILSIVNLVLFDLICTDELKESASGEPLGVLLLWNVALLPLPKAAAAVEALHLVRQTRVEETCFCQLLWLLAESWRPSLEGGQP